MSPTSTPLPLEGIVVLDFSQFLAGPFTALKLADLGARVIKIERPDGGDFARRIALGEVYLDGDSTSFHSFNRGKQGLALNLKDSSDLEIAKILVAKADVLIQNFRPGVIERLGLDYSSVQKINPSLVYASITGYGPTGPWTKRPGQDLLAQSLSGLPWYTGSFDSPPTPFGLALADTLTAEITVQGILAALVRRASTGQGAHVESSLLEAMSELQFEVLAAKLADPELAIERGPRNAAHSLLAAPYGIYRTKDGFMALAMGDVPTLGALIGLPDLARFDDAALWLDQRDEICGLLAAHLPSRSTAEWLEVLDAGDFWCAPVLHPEEFLTSDGFRELDMVGHVTRTTDSGPLDIPYIRPGLRIDGQRYAAPGAAPRVGEHSEAILRDFGIARDEV